MAWNCMQRREGILLHRTSHASTKPYPRRVAWIGMACWRPADLQYLLELVLDVFGTTDAISPATDAFMLHEDGTPERPARIADHRI